MTDLGNSGDNRTGTEKKIPAVVSWSGGKDSALALYRLQQTRKFDIRALFTTFNGKNKRVSMHGISESLIHQQADSIGIPLVKAYLHDPTNEAYEKTMRDQLSKFSQQGMRKMIFGDIYLEDLRQYRERLLKGTEITGAFPLWGADTKSLMQEFLHLKFKTVICSLDAAKLSKNLTGRVITSETIDSLPEDVDPCGENGEFHTFCFDGPVFSQPVSYQIGTTLMKTYPAPGGPNDQEERDLTIKFWFCNLLSGR